MAKHPLAAALLLLVPLALAPACGDSGTDDPEANRFDDEDDGGGHGDDDTGPPAGDEVTCAAYCQLMTDNCHQEQLHPTEHCLTVCESDPTPIALKGAGDVNSIECRMGYAKLAGNAKDDAERANLCASASFSGGDVCGSWCDALCEVGTKVCADHDAQDDTFASVGGCLQSCKEHPSDVLDGISQVDQHFGYGDTVQCRLHHLWAAIYDDNWKLHCGHASEDSTNDTCDDGAEPNSINYCAFATGFCDGMFPNMEACQAALEGFEVGAFTDTDVATLGCLNHWIMTSPDDASACDKADPFEGVCVADDGHPADTPDDTGGGGDDVPALKFFYVIHTHAGGDYAPYASEVDYDKGENLLTTQADNMLEAIEGIQGVLDDHGAVGTWEVVYGTAKGLCEHDGPNHIFDALQDAGHEVAVHAHGKDDAAEAYASLADNCGIDAKVTSGYAPDAQKQGNPETYLTLATVEAADLGMSAYTENMAPSVFSSDGPASGAKLLCPGDFGTDNDMWMTTGQFLYPWRADYENGTVCDDSSGSDFVFIDHVSIEWMILEGQGKPDYLETKHFDQLQTYFDNTIDWMAENKPERTAVWGFVTHITEFAEGNDASNGPRQASLDALDAFLSHVAAEAAKGRVEFMTATEIADLVRAE